MLQWSIFAFTCPLPQTVPKSQHHSSTLTPGTNSASRVKDWNNENTDLFASLSKTIFAIPLMKRSFQQDFIREILIISNPSLGWSALLMKCVLRHSIQFRVCLSNALRNRFKPASDLPFLFRRKQWRMWKLNVDLFTRLRWKVSLNLINVMNRNFYREYKELVERSPKLPTKIEWFVKIEYLFFSLYNKETWITTIKEVAGKTESFIPYFQNKKENFILLILTFHKNTENEFIEYIAGGWKMQFLSFIKPVSVCMGRI